LCRLQLDKCCNIFTLFYKCCNIFTSFYMNLQVSGGGKFFLFPCFNT
jgi:hypothetical protein